MKHAFLIIAHNNWDQLKRMIEVMDSDLCDFYIHVNSKVDIPRNTDFSVSTKRSKVFFVPRVPIIWGNYGICNASLVALNASYLKGGTTTITY